MRIYVMIAAAALTAGLVWSQEAAKPAAEGLEATIVPVKTLTGDSFNRLVQLLDVFGVPLRADERLRTILVYARPDQAAAIQKVVAELDQPGSQAAIGRNIELTMSFLRCPATASADARSVPAELQPVARQLQVAGLCQNAELWEVVPMRLQEGKDLEQSLRLPASPATPGGYTILHIRLDPTAVGTKDRGKYVRFGRVGINFRIPVATGPAGSGQYQYVDVGVNTAGDFYENQKTVLGKVSGNNAENIYAVVTLNVLD